MKVAIIGSRSLSFDVGAHVPCGADVIISGGAVGIDMAAARYAKENGIAMVEVLPDYNRYGRGATIRRNNEIIDMADIVIALWDGKSRGTKYVIDRCKKMGKECTVILRGD